MTRGKMIGLMCASAVLATAPAALAQRGMGDEVGVARRAVDVQRVTLDGKVKEVIEEACKKTTGWSSLGTHFLLETDDEKVLNVHLGPAVVVGDLAKRLKPGQAVSVKGFRTEKMPGDEYVAIEVNIDGKTLTLRDEDLRPTWAGPQGKRFARGRGYADRPGSGWDKGRMMGRGSGRGMGRGPMCGRAGRGYGWGNRGSRGGRMMCCPQGRGMGPGMNRGRGMGAGMGRGPGMGRGMMQGPGRGQGLGGYPGQTAELQRRLEALEAEIQELRAQQADDQKPTQSAKPAKKQ